MFNTSADALNLVLSICLAALTFFLCWAIYYFIASIKRIHQLISLIESGVAKAEEVIEMARDKMKSSTAYLMILGEVAKRVMEFIQEKRTKKTAKKK